MMMTERYRRRKEKTRERQIVLQLIDIRNHQHRYALRKEEEGKKNRSGKKVLLTF
jgi:hypothetical protein